ncbi:hypothetical protein K492DRAFT_76131 [Lichtheimia hyalospora FSU 10163]|nr:hypothetical protein K492DRAFT_76131 [Lichtheimia hyalospora FSU 10163]
MDHDDGITPTSPDTLGWPNVFGASIFVLLAAYISHALGTRLEVPLIISGVRCALQLTLMGLVLDDVLGVDNGYVIMIITVALVLLGAYETVHHRAKQTIQGLLPLMICILLLSNGVTSILCAKFTLNESPAWKPVTFIPVMGMLLGSSMGSVAMAISLCVESVLIHAPIIETKLSFGASRYEAIKVAALLTIRTAMLPQLTQLSVMGMINIPGMLAGQIQAGTSATQAVLYQVCIMFAMTASNGIGVLLTVCACMRLLVDANHVIRKDRIIQSHSTFYQVIVRGLNNMVQWCTGCGSRRRRRHYHQL